MMTLGKISSFYLATIIVFVGVLLSPYDLAWSCGGTARTWTGATNAQWSNGANWSGADAPDTAGEDAVIVSAVRVPTTNANVTIGCLEIQSGSLSSVNSRTLTLQGNYFRNLTLNSLVVNSGHTNFTINMNGGTAQTFENVDTINRLIISNNSTVTFTNPFVIRNALTITGTTTKIIINADLTLNAASTLLTIPAGVTVEIANGAILTANEGVTVNGTLTVKDGAKLVIGNGKTLQVSSSGILNLTGSSGNVATLTSTN
jgi:hypothetical protein